jgi:hypothetical protein
MVRKWLIVAQSGASVAGFIYASILLAAGDWNSFLLFGLVGLVAFFSAMGRMFPIGTAADFGVVSNRVSKLELKASVDERRVNQLIGEAILGRVAALEAGTVSGQGIRMILEEEIEPVLRRLDSVDSKLEEHGRYLNKDGQDINSLEHRVRSAEGKLAHSGDFTPWSSHSGAHIELADDPPSAVKSASDADLSNSTPPRAPRASTRLHPDGEPAGG